MPIIDRSQNDAVKGLLIILIVLGHNAYVSAALPQLFGVLYSFHVYCFLFLVFTRPEKGITKKYASDLIIRYLVPFWIFSLISFSIYHFLFNPPESTTIIRAIVDIAIGSAESLKRSTGFQLYWYLPTLVMLILLRESLNHINNRFKYIAIAAIIAFHGFIPLLPDKIKFYDFMGFLIAIYILPLGMLIDKLHPNVSKANPVARAGIMVIFLGSIVFLWIGRFGLVNLGPLKLYGYADLTKMLFFDMIPVVAFFSVLIISPYLLKIRLFAELGRYSLIIYLSHQLIFRFLEKAIEYLSTHIFSSHPQKLFMGILSFLITLAAAYLVSLITANLRVLRVTVFPRNAHEWPVSRAMTHLFSKPGPSTI
jgi:fucose 4-O-acetylase-like acetyltransferase